jgi:hypothetical protein
MQELGVEGGQIAMWIAYSDPMEHRYATMIRPTQTLWSWSAQLSMPVFR